ncbi:MAG: UDP-2,3-diacylglucosamine diphosphatase LpxI [Planctomycetota bacterium]|uniref:LpxI family protein n=1 Tax=uncultured Gimesia sp. TaxID=1678688 RepID=UPI0026393FAA|nr:UDP-2,3-diacylglucosamine diphosphatase LpxI [uncultured Gimesia sp.]
MTELQTPDIKTSRQIGLLAGAGRFPIVFAEHARKQGYSVCCLGIFGMANEDLVDVCDTFHWIPLARIGRAIKLFHRENVSRIVMAGKIEKTVLFSPFRIFKLLPDLRTLHMWYRYAKKDRKDDTLLLAVIKEFERDNLFFESALDYCPELLVKHGFLTKRHPSPSQWEDIKMGWDIAKQMGQLDIGQSIVINDKAVIAVEAIEGTDRAIQRAGELCKRGGFTVVKVAKPQQDRRFDVPTVGIKTLQTMHEAGGRVLAIESNQTIMIDQQEVADLADKLGIAIVSLNEEELTLQMAS